MPERREHVRIVGPFEGHWHGGSGATECRITDISLGGCFVETILQPQRGEATEVSVRFHDGTTMTLAGHVVYTDSGVGFGVAFRRLTDEEVEALRKHLDLPP